MQYFNAKIIQCEIGSEILLEIIDFFVSKNSTRIKKEMKPTMAYRFTTDVLILLFLGCQSIQWSGPILT